MKKHMLMLCSCIVMALAGCDDFGAVPEYGSTDSPGSKELAQAVNATGQTILPGRVEAEQYREGGEGIGYHDTTATNEGGAYRTDGVDVEPCGEGGFNVGWIESGEWLHYDVDVQESGLYRIDLRVAKAWSDPNATMRIELNGTPIAGKILVPSTGGFQTWQTVSVANVRINAGAYTMRLFMEGNTFNINWMEFTLTQADDAQPGESIVPLAKRIAWKPGIPGDFPYRDATANVRTFGAIGDGSANDTVAFRNAIASLPADGGILFIPAGRYRITSTLQINRGIVLRGEGASKTRLLFSLPTSGGRFHCIAVTKDVRGNFTKIVSGFDRGSRELTVESAASFQPGNLVEIEENNDAAVMYTKSDWNQGWAQNAVGQTAVVTSVAGNKVTLDTPLYMNYKSSLNPRVRTRDYVKYAGIEKLALQLTTLTQGGDNIFVRYAAYCLIKEVESIGCSGYDAHIRLENSYRCEVRRSYVHDTLHKSGRAYGVDTFHSHDCLIEDNIFGRMSSPMMVHVGSSGNVIAYNYDTDPSNGWGGCSLHGHYGNYNLFEENVTAGFDAGDWWGPAGPGNVALRNRWTLSWLRIMDNTKDLYVVGNALTRSPVQVQIIGGADRILRHGNSMAGTIQWDPSVGEHEVPWSYYHKSKPAFLGSKPWPLIRPEAPNEGTIPAQDRFASGRPIE